MVKLKTASEIELLAAGGRILGQILADLARAAVPGVTTHELDMLARELIQKHKSIPAFLNYNPGGHTPFPAALCASVNSAVVHGLPSDTKLADGDIIGLDLGLIYQGMYLDAARTVGVGNITHGAQRLLDITKKALAAGIQAAQPGNTIGDIGYAIENCIASFGKPTLGIVRELVGHGVGYAVHEEPKVPNYGRPGRGMKLEPGLVIAIEPMLTIGDASVETAEDGWTVQTASGNLAAHEEHTVAITTAGPRILTGA